MPRGSDWAGGSGVTGARCRPTATRNGFSRSRVLRVGHDHPADIALADADPPGAERLQPGDLGGLAGGAKIQMQPVLGDLALGDLEEHQVGSDAMFRAASGGSRQTWSSAANVRRRPSADSQK